MGMWDQTVMFLRRLAVLAGLGTISACGTLTVLTETSFPNMAGAPSTGNVYYVTDRAPDPKETGATTYSFARSPSMAFGEAVLGFDRLTFDEGSRAIRVRAVTERTRFPSTPLPVVRRGNDLVPDATSVAAYRSAEIAFQRQVSDALRRSGQDEVVVFIHGFNNAFEDALTTTVNIWQAADRTMVPVAYTWPADNPGLFGYFRDSESGEFSIFHLKETLRLLAGVPGLKDIHVIAHSRGTDVATTALREMVIAARAAGQDPRRSLKVDNLVLAAPDLDFDVVRQRLIAERFALAFGMITVYMNPMDEALGLAQAVNAGQRFGRLSYDDLSVQDRTILNAANNVHFVDVSGVVSPRGHSYFRENPVVLTDIVTLLRTDAPPESDTRNLSHVGTNFWMLEQFPETGFTPADR